MCGVLHLTTNFYLLFLLHLFKLSDVVVTCEMVFKYLVPWAMKESDCVPCSNLLR